MLIRENQFNDFLFPHVDALPLESAIDFFRVIILYIKIMNNIGMVNTISVAYIKNYDGRSIYKKYQKYIDPLWDWIGGKSFSKDELRKILKNCAKRIPMFPTTVKGIKWMSMIVRDESLMYIKRRKSLELRQNLVNKFKLAIKKYLHLTYTLGFNEPSECAKFLVERHKIDKYIMSGEFPVMLLPFLPQIEDSIKTSYEHYVMKDAWEVLKGMYYNQKDKYDILALEIKSAFNKNIPNFSQYIDNMYTETYYKMMIQKQNKSNQQ